MDRKKSVLLVLIQTYSVYYYKENILTQDKKHDVRFLLAVRSKMYINMHKYYIQLYSFAYYTLYINGKTKVPMCQTI